MKRPILWKQALRLARRKISDDDEKGRLQSLEWCKSKAVNLEEFLLKFGVEHHSFSKLNPEIYAFALKRYQDSRQDLGGGANMDLLYNLSLQNNVNYILETGVAYGWSSLAILAALNQKNRGTLVSVDMPYPKINNESIVGSLIPSNLMHRWTLFRESDRTGIQKSINYFKGPVDMIHYDSDKSYSGKHWAYPKLWTSLRSGGCFISDDIQDNIAFKEFCDSIMITSTIISYDNKYLGILIKP